MQLMCGEGLSFSCECRWLLSKFFLRNMHLDIKKIDYILSLLIKAMCHALCF